MDNNSIIKNIVYGVISTTLSHPFHVLYTMNLNNKLKLKDIIKNSSIKMYSKGYIPRTIQCILSYIVISNISNNVSNNYTNNNFIKYNTTGIIENLIVRQPFLTISSSLINNKKIINKQVFYKTCKFLPISCVNRGFYLFFSQYGKNQGESITNNILLSNLLSVAYAIPFITISEKSTQLILCTNNNTRHILNQTFNTILKSYFNVYLITRELIFLYPILYK